MIAFLAFEGTMLLCIVGSLVYYFFWGYKADLDYDDDDGIYHY